ncbi:MAG: hypothetical protein JRN27_07505 [Nitrososphaerota archaeon]|nr:hypothetical protein [Nitrososphaerota archaeon]MDG6975917.1 hypothetical protein [Nitrososphaerota archaeon]
MDWGRVAPKDFERQLRGDKVLEQFAKADLSDREMLGRGLRAQRPQDVVMKAA